MILRREVRAARLPVAVSMAVFLLVAGAVAALFHLATADLAKAERLQAHRIATTAALRLEHHLAASMATSRTLAAWLHPERQHDRPSFDPESRLLFASPAVLCLRYVSAASNRTYCRDAAAGLRRSEVAPLQEIDTQKATASFDTSTGGKHAGVYVRAFPVYPGNAETESPSEWGLVYLDTAELLRASAVAKLGKPMHAVAVYQHGADGRNTIHPGGEGSESADPVVVKSRVFPAWEVAVAPVSGWTGHGIASIAVPLLAGATVAVLVYLLLRAQTAEATAALRDPLTGLPNRRLFEERARLALAQSKRTGTFAAILFLDLDGFKPVNDRLGHQAGDALLCKLARRLRRSLRSVDTVARLGGDEFVVVLNGLSDIGSLHTIAQGLVDRVGRPFETDGQPLRIGASVGVSVYPRDGTDLSMLLKRADEAMYAAKRQGGGRLAMHSLTRGGHDTSCQGAVSL